MLMTSIKTPHPKRANPNQPPAPNFPLDTPIFSIHEREKGSIFGHSSSDIGEILNLAKPGEIPALSPQL
jgi:hypothetical protein